MGLISDLITAYEEIGDVVEDVAVDASDVWETAEGILGKGFIISDKIKEQSELDRKLKERAACKKTSSLGVAFDIASFLVKR